MGSATGTCCCDLEPIDPPVLIVEQNGWIAHGVNIQAGRNDIRWNGWQYLQGGGENYAYATSDNRITYVTIQETTTNNWTVGYYVCSYPPGTANDLTSIIAGASGQVVHFSATQNYVMTYNNNVNQEHTTTFTVNLASPVQVSIRNFERNDTNNYITSTGNLNLTIYRRNNFSTAASSPKTVNKTTAGPFTKITHNGFYNRPQGVQTSYVGLPPPGTFYLMYSANIIQTRWFVTPAPAGKLHTILVNLSTLPTGTWSYLTTANTWVTFTPTTGDYLISQVDANTLAVITSYENNFGTISTIQHGWATGAGREDGYAGFFQFGNTVPSDMPVISRATWSLTNVDIGDPDGPGDSTKYRDIDIACSGFSFRSYNVPTGNNPNQNRTEWYVGNFVKDGLLGPYFTSPPRGNEDYARPFHKLKDLPSGGERDIHLIAWLTGPFDNDYGWPIKNIDLSFNTDAMPTMEEAYPFQGAWYTLNDANYPPPTSDKILDEPQWDAVEGLNPITDSGFGITLPIAHARQSASFRYLARTTAGDFDIQWTGGVFYRYLLNSTGTDGLGDYTVDAYINVSAGVSGGKIASPDPDFESSLVTDTDSAPMSGYTVTSYAIKQYTSGFRVSGRLLNAESQLNTLLGPYAGTIINMTCSLTGINTPT